MRANLLIVVLLSMGALAGCIGSDEAPAGADEGADVAPFLGYAPPEPDMSLELVESDHIIAGEGVDIHVRVKRPEGDGPFPVVAQFTPYTAPGQNVIVNGAVEPAVGCQGVVLVGVGCESTFDQEFVRRGYAFAYADVRGTGDSTGCLDLRGNADIADAWHLTEWLGTQDWSNGNVGFIGASYPGSEAHMAAIAGNEHLKATIPVVASTSFYHYHHNDGVPYNGNHALGGTNTGYTQNAIMPTVNPQNTNYVTRYAEEAQCGYHENALEHGGLDQTGAYYDWWVERNLRPRAENVEVPVLMAQGLADWNVKPDHIMSWFNDIPATNASKTLIAGQWPHAWPDDEETAYGDWWTYAASFFDTFLKEVETGMFATDTAWVQDTLGTWHRSADWPLLPGDRDDLVLHLGATGTLGAAGDTAASELSWYACSRDRINMGVGAVAGAEALLYDCETTTEPQSLVFESEAFAEDTVVSGVPLLDLVMKSDVSFTHLTVLMEVIDADGDPVERTVDDRGLGTRENYGYLNPTFRDGIDAPREVPVGTPYNVTIDLYPQEDVVKAGERLRITVASNDQGRTIESYEPGFNSIVFGPDAMNTLTLPVRPAALQGVRLG